jgi:hypothetical protein
LQKTSEASRPLALDGLRWQLLARAAAGAVVVALLVAWSNRLDAVERGAPLEPRVLAGLGAVSRTALGTAGDSLG